MFEPVIAPSGTLLGLLQRGRGDGTLHALTAPRAEALAALNHCVLRDPRHDWQVENRSLYYARLYLDLNGELDEIEAHLFDVEDVLDTEESRTGLALAVLGHLASYGRRDALALLRRYAASGSNWAWALDELALRDDDAGLRALAAPVLAGGLRASLLMPQVHTPEKGNNLEAHERLAISCSIVRPCRRHARAALIPCAPSSRFG